MTDRASARIAPTASRLSSVEFEATPVEIERRAGFDVVVAYEGDASASTALVDLSHRPRWDVQARGIDGLRPFDRAIPTSAGDVSVESGILTGRMNGTQAFVWHVGPEAAPQTPTDVGVTDTTDSHCWLALVGREVSAALERASSLDLLPPGRTTPFLTQGPVLHVPCQVVTWRPDAVLMAFSRGYGQTFVDALLHSTHDLGVRPAGERVFTDWVDRSASA